MNIKLDNQYLCEVFELLCSIPFEEGTTLRHPGIEQMIEQISEVLNA